MDLKKYAGKSVLVQLRGPWLAANAPSTVGTSPEAKVVRPRLSDEPALVHVPFLYADVDDEGLLFVRTDHGGCVSVDLNPDVIHSVTAVVTYATAKEEAKDEEADGAEPSRIIRPGLDSGISGGG